MICSQIKSRLHFDRLSAFRADLECPIYDDAILLPLSFWLEGVVQCAIALLGLIGNLISAIILSR